MAHVTSSAMRLFTVTGGEGRPLILLHGGLSSHAGVRAWCAPLEARYRVITPDLRASGRSIFHGALTWDDLADDVAELIDEPAAIGGVSFGAAVATKVALRYPAKVAALIVLSPAFDGVTLTPAQDAAMRAMAEVGARAPAEGIEVLLPLFDRLPPEVRERATRVVTAYDPRSVAALTSFMASGVQPFAPPDLAKLAMPTLVVPGSDPTHPPEIADGYRGLRRALDPSRYAEGISEFLAAQWG